MLTKKEIEKKVYEVISEIADIDKKKITSKTRLIDELGIDSFAAVELFYNAGEEFGISFDNDELKKLLTVADLVKIVQKKINK